MRKIIFLVIKDMPLYIFVGLLVGGGWYSLASLDAALKSGSYTSVFWGIGIVVVSFVWLGLLAFLQKAKR